MIKNILYLEGHQNPISGSKVMTILLKGRILPIGGASEGEGLRLQPAQQACLLLFRLPSSMPTLSWPDTAMDHKQTTEWNKLHLKGLGKFCKELYFCQHPRKIEGKQIYLLLITVLPQRIF